MTDVRELHEKHKFLVEVAVRVASAQFEKCSELSVEAAKILYWEGASVIPHKTAGRLTFSDVTLTRGTSSSVEFHNWFKAVNNATVSVPRGGFGRGDVLPQFKADTTILQLNRDNSTIRQWLLSQAFPIKVVAGEWDNDADAVVIESLTLTYDTYDIITTNP